MLFGVPKVLNSTSTPLAVRRIGGHPGTHVREDGRNHAVARRGAFGS